MHAERRVHEPDPLGAVDPILLPPPPVRGVAVFQVRRAGLQLRGNVRALVKMQAVHLLDGIVDSGDEGRVGNGVLGGAVVAASIAGLVAVAVRVVVVVVAAAVGGRRLHREIGEVVSLAVLTADAHLAEGDGPISSVNGKDRIGLEV